MPFEHGQDQRPMLCCIEKRHGSLEAEISQAKPFLKPSCIQLSFFGLAEVAKKQLTRLLSQRIPYSLLNTTLEK
jgi:hypothetical protein